MKGKKIIDFLITLVAVTVATFLFGVAVNCYITAGLGSDSVSVFQQGISHSLTALVQKINPDLSVSMGIAAYIYMAIVFIIDLFISRENIGWTTVLNALMLGTFIDLVGKWFKGFYTLTDALYFRMILLAMGILLVATSCVILIRLNKGKNALDAVAWGLTNRLKWPYRLVRICVDGILMGIGWLLGDKVGLGSIAAVFLTGPVIQLFLSILSKKEKR